MVWIEIQRAEIFLLTDALKVYLQEYEGVADPVKIARMANLGEELDAAGESSEDPRFSLCPSCGQDFCHCP